MRPSTEPDGGRAPSCAPEYVGNVDFTASPERFEFGRKASDLFLAALPDYAGLPPQRILLVVDGVRPALYDSASAVRARDSYAATMLDYLQEQARNAGFIVIDMGAVFVEEHRLSGARFEFSTDDHWNSVGHGLVARQLVQEINRRGLLGSDAHGSPPASGQR